MAMNKILEHYEEVANIPLKADLSNYNEIVSWNKTKHEQRFQFTMDSIQKCRDEIQTVLDVGCGSGLYVYKLKQLGLSAKGIDFSPKQIRNCKKFFNLTDDDVQVGNILNIEYPENTFDFVISLGTHLLVNGGKQGVKKAIKELVRVSKKYVLIDFHNSCFFLHYKNRDPQWTFWTPAFLKELCASNKLEIVRFQRAAIRKDLNWLSQSWLFGWTNLFNEYSFILLRKKK